MGQIGIPEVLVIALLVTVLFGAKKLPEIGQALGKAIREFKKAGKDIDSDIKEVTSDSQEDKKA